MLISNCNFYSFCIASSALILGFPKGYRLYSFEAFYFLQSLVHPKFFVNPFFYKSVFIWSFPTLEIFLKLWPALAICLNFIWCSQMSISVCLLPGVVQFSQRRIRLYYSLKRVSLSVIFLKVRKKMRIQAS